ncbi:F-type H+-transporting ATPase subunit gamma [Melghirimyces profundicolus]|uniref:ATP synthase gamma chain n=1 Tax=Melghirimyces profundicolus TaxID=1242148 RepID=A0A2T6C2G5_9BACL|nr:ATP synthase F1 subunit gamma [Melghirimyces profundicolus]PTX62516.1 F-type H+-transporting ATPase subunit gamma [Melghirimyces profundicolus]
MAESMRDIKRKIRSVQNMKQITKAFEMVSAAKLRRAQEQAESARPYADKIREVIASVASGTQGVKHPMLVSRPVKKTGYLVITSDRGLAGGFNANLLRTLVKTVAERHRSKEEYVIFVIGRKGREFLKRRGYPVIGEVTGLADSPEFSDIKQIASKAVGMYADEEYDELYLLYNEFINPVTQRPVEKRLLPLSDMKNTEAASGPKALYEYEPSAEEVLAELLPRYAETLIYSALLESKASEHGARMTAMGNASDNASDMIGTYTLQYNRARQAAITQELAEIVGGASALE